MASNGFIRWWVGKSLPDQHIFIQPESRPNGTYQLLRLYFRKWFVHPLKRRIAKYYIVFLQKVFGLTVIGITGSAGKTTTKEMLASILKRRGPTVYSYANIDPIYNIPTTILKCRPSTKFLVLEMGIEYPGEMDFYIWLARPRVGIVTNIYPTHTLFLKNVENVAKEKLKLINALPKDGVAVLNAANEYTLRASGKIKSRVCMFGEGGEVVARQVQTTQDFKTKYILHTPVGEVGVSYSLVGAQFVENALAACAASYSMGVDLKSIAMGLADFASQEHRMNIVKMRRGSILIDDSYNNNPEAARKALDTLVLISKGRKKIAVIGEMLELGKSEVDYHKKLGAQVSSKGIDYLVGVGELMKYAVNSAKKRGLSTFWVEDGDQALDIVKTLAKDDSAILVKGSRKVGLDRLVQGLLT